jgi:hypothetical protein
MNNTIPKTTKKLTDEMTRKHCTNPPAAFSGEITFIFRWN